MIFHRCLKEQITDHMGINAFLQCIHVRETLEGTNLVSINLFLGENKSSMKTEIRFW